MTHKAFKETARKIAKDKTARNCFDYVCAWFKGSDRFLLLNEISAELVEAGSVRKAKNLDILTDTLISY